MTAERPEFAEIRRKLRVGIGEKRALTSWLERTRLDPERFRNDLFAYCRDKRGRTLRSRPNGGYDLYHDVVLAHPDRRRPALMWQGDGGLTSLSFAEVHKAASDLAGAWAAQGAEAGASVGIVQTRNGHWLLAVLAALQLGLVVSLVSHDGPALVRARLKKLSPDFVFVSETLARSAAPFPGEILRATSVSPPRPLAGSHMYDEGAPVFRLLSPFTDGIVEVPASFAHHALLRDGELVLALDASDVVAAPGWDAAEAQPFLFLTSLMAGAAWLELSVDDLETDPGIIKRAGVSVIGIGAAARDCALRGEPPKRSWFYNLTNTFDIEKWAALAQRMAGRQVSGFGVVTTPASAGVLLFGLAATAVSLNVWPAPGMQFDLTEIGGGELAAHGGVGRFSPRLPESVAPGVPNLILASRDDEYILGGCLDLGRDSHWYPSDAVVDVVRKSFPEVRHAEVVLTPGRLPNEAKVALVLFTVAPEATQRGFPNALGSVRRILAEQLGARWVPDRVEVYPLEPRFVSGEVDREHCRSQYLSGALVAKTRTEIFRLSSRIRHLFATPSKSS